MFRLIASILAVCLAAATANAAVALQAEYVQVDMEIKIPETEPFSPSMVLKIGRSATLRRTSENGAGHRMDVDVPMVTVDHKGRAIAEIRWHIYRIDSAATLLLSQGQAGVLLGAEEKSAFSLQSQDGGLLIDLGLKARVLSSSELIEKFGTTAPDIARR